MMLGGPRADGWRRGDPGAARRVACFVLEPPPREPLAVRSLSPRAPSDGRRRPTRSEAAGNTAPIAPATVPGAVPAPRRAPGDTRPGGRVALARDALEAHPAGGDQDRDRLRPAREALADGHPRLAADPLDAQGASGVAGRGRPGGFRDRRRGHTLRPLAGDA